MLITTSQQSANQLQLWQKILLAMIAGIILGHFAPDLAIYLKPFGQVFSNCLKMIVIPLVFFAILYGMTNISDLATFSRIGMKAFFIYSFTTICAVIIGIAFANIMAPGVGSQITLSNNASDTASTSITDILINIVPNNPIAAMANGNTLQVVVFAFFIGAGVIGIKEKGNLAREIIISFANVVFKVVELVIKLTPYGVFCIISVVTAEFGVKIVIVLSHFIATVLSAFLFQYLLFGVILKLVAKLNPLLFYTKMLDTKTIAFTTASSKAALPSAIHVLQEKLGVSKQSAGFILPLGASMNMDGTAIYLSICAIFFAQVLGIDLNMGQYLMIVLTSTLGSIGAAGIPGGSIIMMSLVFNAIGIPLEGITLIMGVDRIIDMFRTVVNITGDCTVTVVVDKLENNLNEEIYYQQSCK